MNDLDAAFPEPPSRLDAAPLYVSLFLVLLVFFIVLNAISTPAPKKQQTVALGVSEHFSEKSGTQLQQTVEPLTAAQKENGDRLAGQVEALAKSYVEAVDIQVQARGDMAILRLPVLRLFKRDDTLRSGLALYDAIVRADEAWAPGQRLDVTCVMYLPANASPQAQAQALRRASLLAAHLSARGLRVSAALMEGKTGEAAFIFRPRSAKARWPAPRKAG